MSAIATVARQWRVVCGVAAIEIAMSWSIATSAAGAVGGSLRHHPEGGAAIFAENGRLALDLFFRQQSAFESAGRAAAVAGVAYALVAPIILALLVRALSTATPVSIPRAAIASFDAVPVVLVISLAGLIGYCVCGAVGWLSLRGAIAFTRDSVNPFVADMLRLCALLPALLLAAAAHVWHDAAIVEAAGRRNAGALTAMSAAALRLTRAPLSTLGVGALFAAASTLVLAFVPILSGPAVRNVALVVGLQQAALLVRIVLRAGWLAWLLDHGPSQAHEKLA